MLCACACVGACVAGENQALGSHSMGTINVLKVLKIDHIRIPSIGLELACNGG